MENELKNTYLQSAIKQFLYYKSLGEKAMAQVTDEQLFFSHHPESNSMAVIVKHLAGNMISRWTEPFTTDGEKPWRNRDGEFLNDLQTRTQVLEVWEKGWKCLMDFLGSLRDGDFEKILYIRNEGHSLTDAINRQLCHYPYHIGQMVFLAKLFAGENWKSLSIPRNKSADYNTGKFSQEKGIRHFTDDMQ